MASKRKPKSISDLFGKRICNPDGDRISADENTLSDRLPANQMPRAELAILPPQSKSSEHQSHYSKNISLSESVTTPMDLTSNESQSTNSNPTSSAEPSASMTLKQTHQCSRVEESQASSQYSQLSDLSDLFLPEQLSKLHCYYKCRTSDCCALSIAEIGRVKNEKKKDRFQHEWLFRKTISFCSETRMWWPIFVEGEGLYCYLCRKHQSKSAQNKSETFAQLPSTQFKLCTLVDHIASAKHRTTVSNEMLNRVSIFQRQINEKSSTKIDVLATVFHAMYWIAKENIANRKVASLLELMELLGLNKIKLFSHRSAGSYREIMITIGDRLRDQTSEKLHDESSTAQYYGLLVDDVADMSNTEQMVTFIQYFDSEQGIVECKFLSIANVLEKSDSANAATMHAVITEQLERLQIPLKNLRGLVTDGASVMIGRLNGLAALLKKDVNTMVSVHCICHRLALACTDTNENLKKIKDVEIEVTQLWKIFDYSPKKLAAYLKIQQELKEISMGKKAGSKISKRLKKACKTRWLSFDNAISAVVSDIPAILQTLRHLKADPGCYGLLKKLAKAKKVGTLYILNAVLPVLSDLSRGRARGRSEAICRPGYENVALPSVDGELKSPSNLVVKCQHGSRWSTSLSITFLDHERQSRCYVHYAQC